MTPYPIPSIAFAMFKNLVIIIALEILLINPPMTGTTKKANLEYLYFLQTVCIVVIETGTAPKPNPVCPTAIIAAS